MKKILTVVGARPQFIKASVVSRLISGQKSLSETILHTGQHYDFNMSELFFKELEIPRPHINLGVKEATQGKQTAEMLSQIECYLLEERPDLVLVYGDTNSTLAASLAAVKLHIPLAHVEAGLRSFNKKMPEEINRICTDHCSSVLFSTSSVATNNLIQEGVPAEKIIEAGDVMFDAVLFYKEHARERKKILGELGLVAGEYILATVHRPENTDDISRLQAIFEGLEEQGKVVVPLHPRTRNVLSREGLLARFEKSLKIIEPLGYLEMVCLLQNARLLATDSGGMQKEAYYVGVPSITLRDQTEWTELLDIGATRLISPVSGVDALSKAMKDSPKFKGSSELYGGGKAGERIIEALVSL